MTPDKLESWLRRERRGAVRLRVVATEITGVVPVMEWAGEEIRESVSPAEEVFRACADYCDSKGEPVQFRIEWLRADGTACGNCFHKHAPLEETDTNVRASEAGLSQGNLVQWVLNRDVMRERIMVGALGTIIQGFQTALSTLSQQNAEQGRQLTLQAQQLAAYRTSDPSAAAEESTEEARAESIARAGAWNKLSEIAPHLVQFVIDHRAQRGSNGAAGGH